MLLTKKHRFITLVMIVACSAVSCAAPGTQGSGGSSGGTINAAWTLGGKCEALLKWVEILDQELPGIKNTYDHQHQQTYTIPRLSNLFRDRYFVPVFGTPFDKMTAEERSRINTEIINGCAQPGSQHFMKYRESIGLYLHLLNSAFTSWSGAIASNLPQMRTREAWLDDSLKSLKDLPLDQKSLALVQSRFDEGTAKLNILWPSEYQNFISVYTKSRNNMAGALLTKLSKEVDGMEPSLSNMRRIKKEILPNVAAYQKAAGTAPGADLTPQFTKKLEAMVNRIMPETVSPLQSIPDTEVGLKQSEQWYKQFEEDFSDFKHMPSVTDALATFSRKRNDIYRGVQPSFLFSLNALEPSYDNVSKTDSLVKEAFPLAVDYSLPVHDEYKKAALAKREQILGKLSEKRLAEIRNMPKTLDSAVAILQWRKEVENQFWKFRSMGPIASVFSEGENKRIEILKGASQEFVQKQESLPPTREGLRRSVDMLDTIFPTLNDEQLSVYPAYRKIVLDRIASIRSRIR